MRYAERLGHPSSASWLETPSCQDPAGSPLTSRGTLNAGAQKLHRAPRSGSGLYYLAGPAEPS